MMIILFFLLVVRLLNNFFVDDFLDWLFVNDWLFDDNFFYVVVRFFLGVVALFLVDDFLNWFFVDDFLDWFFVDDDFLLVVVRFFLGVVALFLVVGWFLVVSFVDDDFLLVFFGVVIFLDVVWLFDFFVMVHEDWFVTGLVLTISTFVEGGHESLSLVVFGLEEGITDGTKCIGKSIKLSAESISKMVSG